MGRNTMTLLQKRKIVSASMKVFESIRELQNVMRNSGNNTKECIRVGKLDYAARANVRYWIDRPVLELTTQQNLDMANYLDDIWKECQKENYKLFVPEADNGTT